MAAIGEAVRSHRKPWQIGGDLNMDPCFLYDWAKKLGGEVQAAGGAHHGHGGVRLLPGGVRAGACRGRGGCSTWLAACSTCLIGLIDKLRRFLPNESGFGTFCLILKMLRDPNGVLFSVPVELDVNI